MDNIRLILWFALIGSAWMSYTTWVEENAPPPQQQQALEQATESPEFSLPDLPEPSVGEFAPTAGLPALATQGTSDRSTTDTVRVRTDVLDVLISLQGGDIVRADLPLYPVDKSDPDTVVRLLNDSPQNRWQFQTGVRDSADGPEANHLARFVADASEYTLSDGGETLEVKLRWAESGTLAVSKTYTFRRGRYNIDLAIDVENGAGETWNGVVYSQMVRTHNPVERSYLSVDTYSYTGPVLYDGDKYEKIGFEDLQEEARDQTLSSGWYAAIQHHFLAAAVPPMAEQTVYQAAAVGGEFRLRAVSPTLQVAGGTTQRHTTQLFIGPKLQAQLRDVADGLQLTVDYGFLTPLAAVMFWLLARVYGFIANWGLSIIIVTFLIKLAFYKLTAMSGRSMAKMRKLAPRMKTLQERHKDDRQALSQAMMEMYKREKINPAAGCLPMLVQMPFFFAFYWVLVESVEMRQAPFMLWINDLSVRDPFFIIPLLMGGAMLFQMRLNPAPPDPVQAKVMQIMPVVFTAMFAFFPAGLVLYWLTNTVVSIAQQWRINQLVEREA
jgi:YidC/Oxa1 family membrane protein insertase